MTQLGAQSGERVLHEWEEATHDGPEALGAGSITLTNRRLVFEPERFLWRRKDARSFMLREISLNYGSPQIFMAIGANGGTRVDVVFGRVIESFTFEDRGVASHFASNLHASVAAIWRAARDRRAAAVAPKRAETQPISKVTRCTSCGASVSGAAQSVAVCSYCDTPNQL